MELQGLHRQPLSAPSPQRKSVPAQLRPDRKVSTTAGLEGVREANDSDQELRETFQDFVGQTLFGSMLASMRKTVGKPAYLHGGRTEEVFQKQLDQYIVEDLSDASAQTISDPMYDLFTMQRRS